MLEQQQSQLVAGLRELYRKLQSGESWPGLPLESSHEGHPLTHDILERLDLLHSNPESPIKHEGFEEDFTRLQERLIASGASFVQRRGSVSSDSDPGLAHSDASHDTPQMPTMAFSARHNAPPTPPHGSPFPRPSQLSMPSKSAHFAPTPVVPPTFTPQQLLQQQWMASPTTFDMNMDLDLAPSYDPTMNFEFNQFNMVNTSPLPLEFGDDFDSFINLQAMASHMQQA